MEDSTNHSLFQRFVYEIADILKIFIICFVIVYLLTTFVIKPIRVEGSSMYPTLEDKELGITNVFSARFLGIERFDVVIVHNQEKDEYWVKRVIGLPGDVIEAKADVLYINHEPVEEYYLDPEYVSSQQIDGLFTSDFGPITLSEGEYWLMGDNRIKSEDSRMHGPFKEEEIIGKDIFVLYPFDKMKMISNKK